MNPGQHSNPPSLLLPFRTGTFVASWRLTCGLPPTPCVAARPQSPGSRCVWEAGSVWGRRASPRLSHWLLDPARHSWDKTASGTLEDDVTEPLPRALLDRDASPDTLSLAPCVYKAESWVSLEKSQASRKHRTLPLSSDADLPALLEAQWPSGPLEAPQLPEPGPRSQPSRAVRTRPFRAQHTMAPSLRAARSRPLAPKTATGLDCVARF